MGIELQRGKGLVSTECTCGINERRRYGLVRAGKGNREGEGDVEIPVRNSARIRNISDLKIRSEKEGGETKIKPGTERSPPKGSIPEVAVGKRGVLDRS